ARHMLAKGWRLRALTRNPGSYAGKELARVGVEVMRGDLEDPASLERASRGVYGVYSVQDFWSVGAKREVQQGKNLADAAKKAGAQHFVYSVGGRRRTQYWHSPLGKQVGDRKAYSPTELAGDCLSTRCVHGDVQRPS